MATHLLKGHRPRIDWLIMVDADTVMIDPFMRHGLQTPTICTSRGSALESEMVTVDVFCSGTRALFKRLNDAEGAQ
eukprot:m.349020 g.349020  ORF g.349020 m.349020 type:complete len:76 (-) comp39947_c0_seq1:843-1070(-)